MTLHQSLDPPAPAPDPARFHDLMAGVGYLLFQWSMVERSLDDEITALRRAAGDTTTALPRARSINERLGEWRALLGRGRRRNGEQHLVTDRLGERIQDLARLRNLVANGFCSAAVEGAEPTIRCTPGTPRPGTPDEIVLTLHDLIEAIDAMEQARDAMARLRDPGDS